MPTTDEDLLRDLLRGSTNDLALRPGGAHAIVTRQRRRQVRRRFAAVGVTGVAAAVALTVAESGAAPQAKPSLAGPGQARAVHLTTGQVVLDGLAVRAAAQPDGKRYVVFTEDRAPTKQTSVYDRLTGNMWVYQQGGGAPPVAVVKHGSPTSAELAAKLPANQAALRAFLIKDANADDAKAAAFARRSRPHAAQQRQGLRPGHRLPVHAACSLGPAVRHVQAPRGDARRPGAPACPGQPGAAGDHAAQQ